MSNNQSYSMSYLLLNIQILYYSQSQKVEK